MAGTILAFLQTLWDQLQANSDVLRTSATIGTIVTAVYSLFKAWRQRQKRLRSEVAVEKRLETRLEVPSEPAKRVTNAELRAILSGLKDEFKAETRKSAIIGFIQNLAFFILGTLTSIVVPKLFP